MVHLAGGAKSFAHTQLHRFHEDPVSKLLHFGWREHA